MTRLRCRSLAAAVGMCWSAAWASGQQPFPVLSPAGEVGMPGMAGMAGMTEPVAAAPAGAVRSARDVEILHGTRKVWPQPPRWIPVLRIMPAAPPPRPADPPSKEESKPAPLIESRTIILSGYGGAVTPQGDLVIPAAPWLAPGTAVGAMPPTVPPAVPPAVAPAVPPAALPAVAAPSAAGERATTPQVIIIRDRDATPTAAPATPPAPAEPTPYVLTLTPATLAGLGVGLGGLGIGWLGWRRRQTAAASPLARHPLPYVPLGGEGVLLMGKYNAGPRPDTAERFEIGPSYAEQLQQQKIIAAQNQQALVEFILGQNIALRQQLSPGDESLPVAEEVAQPASPSAAPEEGAATPTAAAPASASATAATTVTAAATPGTPTC